MGIYDREYYKRDGGTLGDWLQPHRVVHFLIVANILTFIAQLVTHAGPGGGV